MTYRLLSTGKGIITTRQPVVEKDNVTFSFVGAPIGSTAVFSTNDATYYREVKAGRCVVPGKYLIGDVSVTLNVFDKSSRIKRYACEGLKVTKITDGVIIAPDDSDLAEEFAKSKIEMDELRNDFQKLRCEFEKLQDAFEKMKEGYGLV